MSLTNEERQNLVRRELEKAHEAYEDIEILKTRGRWNGAANRLYYSVFHAVNALFINDGLEAGRLITCHYCRIMAGYSVIMAGYWLGLSDCSHAAMQTLIS